MWLKNNLPDQQLKTYTLFSSYKEWRKTFLCSFGMKGVWGNQPAFLDSTELVLLEKHNLTAKQTYTEIHHREWESKGIWDISSRVLNAITDFILTSYHRFVWTEHALWIHKLKYLHSNTPWNILLYTTSHKHKPNFSYFSGQKDAVD
jgi:hypothetical protein